MTRSRLAWLPALAVVVAGLLLLDGCGLPSQTQPKYAGAAQSPAPVASGTTPPAPDDGDPTPSGLINNFLVASAGGNLDLDNNTANTENVERLRKFMTDGWAPVWKPDVLVVIRDPQSPAQGVVDPAGLYRVTLDYDLVGTLNKNGVFSSEVIQKHSTAVFTIKTVGGHYRIADIQVDGNSDQGRSLLLISEKAFQDWYDWQPIYFWENNAGPQPKLVPDMRYMPRTLSDPKRVSAVWNALKDGPSQLLNGVVATIPADYNQDTNPVVDSAGVHINLNGKAANKPEGLPRLARQIRWSLVTHPQVYLNIADQAASDAIDSEAGYKSDNAAYLQSSAKIQPDEYYVAGGSVRAAGTSASENSTTPRSGSALDPPPVFAPGPANGSVISAAVDRSLNRAAIVHPGPANVPALKNKQELLVSSPEMPPATPPKYNAVLSGTKLSRPVWMTYPVQRLLIVADNRLQASTDEKGTEFAEVLGPSNQPVPMSAFAVAPEGHRIAYIANGELMVASLALNSTDASAKLVMGQAQPIETTLGTANGVAWLTENVLVVGGKPAKQPPVGVDRPYSVVAVTVDGADIYPLPQYRTEQSPLEVTSVVADYGSPMEQSTLDWPQMPTRILVEMNGQWGHVFRNEIAPLPLLPPAPPASASAEPLKVTAAFYPD